MKKQFCPNCGAEIKPGAKFCPNCGLRFVNTAPQNNGSNQPNPRSQMQRQNMSAMPPKKPNNLKKIIAICAAIIVILGAGATAYIYATQKNHATPAQTAKKHSSKKTSPTKHHKNNMDTKTKKHSDHYSVKDWMLMGYMHYSRKNYEDSRNVSSTGDLVKAVGNDIKNGDLEVKQNSSNDYTLSNKFGDVDVTVNSSDVTVSGDGDDTTPKSELKDNFGDYIDQIEAISEGIDGSSDNTKDTASKSLDKSAKFDDKELVTAAFVDYSYDSATNDRSAQENINSFRKSIQNSKKLINNSYIASDLTQHDFKGSPCYTLTTNIATTLYVNLFLNGDSDQYTLEFVDHGLEHDKFNKSKKDLLKKYGSYKKDIDDLAQGLLNNQSQWSDVFEKFSTPNQTN